MSILRLKLDFFSPAPLRKLPFLFNACEMSKIFANTSTFNNSANSLMVCYHALPAGSSQIFSCGVE